MRKTEYIKALKKDGAWGLLKKYMRNEVYLTDKQLEEVLKLKQGGLHE